MQALWSAYTTPSSSSDEAEPEDHGKRPRLDVCCPPPQYHSRVHKPPTEDRCFPGRYISKRERAEMAAMATMAATISTPIPSPMQHSLPVFENALRIPTPVYVQRKIERFRGSNKSWIPKSIIARLMGHTKGVNALSWSPTHGSLLASAGMDNTSCIWNVWENRRQHLVCRHSFHVAAVKDVQWTSQGTSLLTCGFDKALRLIDVETSVEKQTFQDDQFVNTVRFHPLETDLFLSGGSNGGLRLWDIRTGKAVRGFFKEELGSIMSVDFSKDGKNFASTSDIAQRNASDKTIVIWDFHTEIALSNQVYLEAYTCPSIRYHPYEQSFIAQSNAGYIAIFCARSPYKMNKYKRFEGHQVSGFPIQCNFSLDGEMILTGSANGTIYFYCYRSSKLLKTLQAHQDVCTDVVCHPSLPSVIASCSWDGSICVSE